MKKFSQAIPALHEAEGAAKSELQKSYAEYFKAKLNKFGAKSPAELSPEQKSEFFNEITKDWTRGEGATKAGQADIEEHGVKESAVNEAEVKSEAEFKEYAMVLLKKAHPDDFDEAKANATVEGILKKCDGDFGAAVGMITSSLGESATNEKKDGITPEEMARIQQLKKLKDLKANEGEETCPMCKKDPCECYTNEGNAFGDAVKKAKDAGEKEFEFQGKTYKVEESEAAVNDLNEGDLFLPHTNLPTITEEQLKKDIVGNIGNAFNKLLKDAGIKYNPVTAIESGGRIRFESKPLTGNDLGVMKFGFKEVYINTFSGGSMPKIQKGAADENLMFTPYIWFTINYSYKHGSEGTNSTGSNGCSLYLPGETSDSIYYDIGSYKFLTASQAAKKSEWK